MPPKNKFKNRHRSYESPAGSGFNISPSDTLDIQAVTRAVYVGVGGNISVSMVDGDIATGNKDIILVGVTAGSFLPISITKVYATGTTASSIMGFY